MTLKHCSAAWGLCLVLLSSLPLSTCGYGADTIDPGFCVIRPEEPASVDIFAEHHGRRFYFCCESCRRDFLSDPSRFDGDLESGGDETEAAHEEAAHEEAERSEQWNDHTYAYSQTFWGRVGRVFIAGKNATAWISTTFHLNDPKSRLLATTVMSLMFVVAILWGQQVYRGTSLRPRAPVVLLVALMAMPCFYVDRLRHRLAVTTRKLSAAETERLRLKQEKQDLLDRDSIHYATFLNHGNPPIPRPSELPPSLHKTYYRGNDERSEEMPDGGNYRTVTFEIWIEDANGKRLETGSQLVGPDGKAAPLDLVVQFIRAPDTSSGYFTEDYMKRMYVTMESGDFLGRDQPVRDRVSWRSSDGDRIWRARYALPEGVFAWEQSETDLHPKRVRRRDPSRPYDRGGVVYLCEDRYDRDRMIGGRFHYAIEYDLQSDQGLVKADSDLWMQATYRGRNFAQLQIEDSQWLSSHPIPEKDWGVGDE